MFHLRVHPLTARRGDRGFLRTLHHLRHLGCSAGLHCEGEFCVADVQVHATLSPCMQREIGQALAQLSQHICRAALVSMAADHDEAEYHIGPGAGDADRAWCLRRAALYAERAGEHTLAQALCGRTAYMNDQASP